MKKIIFVVVFMLVSEPLWAREVKVVDGDSLIVRGKMTRLIGIDAPEFFQICQNAAGEDYECGQEATKYMQKMVDDGLRRGDKINCKKKDTDRYNRDLSICRLGKVNLNKSMVEAGWAVTYRHNYYDQQQEDAQKEKRGIWQGKFMRPELHRILQKYQKTQK